ncbi:MAG: hypothetical protein A2W91_17865 [Bacteroidetes bacterium GWF2_38_335]|nr:MAG: hypothetical protein A2W91_17865 [Bacteroidetes bacterium GWF2_38_335]OFY80160.1 MAG: hypothetical protein A2281_12775 [Bacteroidetes bacterium RIFOXYA12_FULL_38_20]HBS88511.1 hypothetical protein [Bacteroidales bacterium]
MKAKSFKALILISLLFLNVTWLIGQDNKNEFIIHSNYVSVAQDDDEYIVIRTIDGEKNQLKVLSKYNFDNQLIEEKEFMVDHKDFDENPCKIIFRDDIVYAIYNNSYYYNGNSQVVSYNFKTKELLKSDIFIIEKSEDFNWEVNSKTVFINYLKPVLGKFIHMLYVINLSNKQIVEMEFDSFGKLYFDNMNNEVLLPVLSKDSLNEFEIVRFDLNGERIAPSYKVKEPKGDKEPEIIISFESKSSFYVIGRYKKEDKPLNKDIYYSPAVFISRYVNGEQSWIKYYDLMDFDGFYKYDKELLEYKKKNEEGKLEASLHLHKPIIINDGLYIVGEVFHKGKSFSGPDPKETNVHELNIITNTVIMKLNMENGEVIWDRSFKSDFSYRCENNNGPQFPLRGNGNELVLVNQSKWKEQLCFVNQNGDIDSVYVLFLAKVYKSVFNKLYTDKSNKEIVSGYKFVNDPHIIEILDKLKKMTSIESMELLKLVKDFAVYLKEKYPDEYKKFEESGNKDQNTKQKKLDVFNLNEILINGKCIITLMETGYKGEEFHEFEFTRFELF